MSSELYKVNVYLNVGIKLCCKVVNYICMMLLLILCPISSPHPISLPRSSSACRPPRKVMKICMNSVGVNKIEQSDKLLFLTLHETHENNYNTVLKISFAWLKAMTRYLFILDLKALCPPSFVKKTRNCLVSMINDECQQIQIINNKLRS